MQRKISVITPVYNGEEYIEKCILSIKNQNYHNYEHIIVDGGSTDSTLEIAKKYEGTYPLKIISEKDNGMYDAIAKGFSMADGEIFAWLNADDTYFLWAFQVMNYVVSQGVNWATCIGAMQNSYDVFYSVFKQHYYVQKWLKKGYYDGRLLRFIQQESTFWTKELWQKSGSGDLIKQYKIAGDFALWKNFAQYEKLFSVQTVIGGFRRLEGQKSSDFDAYYKEVSTEKVGKIKKVAITLLDLFYQSVIPIYFKDEINVVDIPIDLGYEK